MSPQSDWYGRAMDASMRMTSGGNSCVLVSAWSGRPVSPADVMSLLRATFSLFDRIGGDLCGPWRFEVGDSRESARFVDVSAMSDEALLGFVESLFDGERPERGFSYSLRRGDVITSTGWSTQNGALLTFGLGTRKGDYFAVRGDRDQLGASTTMRENATTLVADFVAILRPAYVSFQDRSLHQREIAFWDSHQSGMRRWPAWGYVAYLSDSVARGLNSVMVGAATQRIDSGWLMSTNTQDPDQAAAIWRDLHDRKCIHHLPEM